MDCSPPGSCVHGILQARVLEWVLVPFSKRSPQPRGRIRLPCFAGRFLTIWATRKACLFPRRCFICLSSLVAQMVKNLPAIQKTWIGFLGWTFSLEKRMATHFNIVAWRSPWTEEPGRLQSMVSQRAGHNWVTKHENLFLRNLIKHYHRF